MKATGIGTRTRVLIHPSRLDGGSLWGELGLPNTFPHFPGFLHGGSLSLTIIEV
jgi:hypothetical protein